MNDKRNQLRTIFVNGTHGDAMPKQILNDIANWMESAKLSKLTINVNLRSAQDEPLPVTVEYTGYDQMRVERLAPVSIDD